MPKLNVLTWNSGGETQQAAEELKQALVYLHVSNHAPDVILVQEANLNPDGPIRQMLATLIGYHPPMHAQEGGVRSAGYLMSVRGSIGIHEPLTRVDLLQDETLVATLAENLRRDVFDAAMAELRTMHMPAGALLVLSAQGPFVPCASWHTPRDPGVVLGTRLPGGANADAFLFLQWSGLYQNLVSPGAGNISIIAGDLNVTEEGLTEPTGLDDLPELLPDWDGVTANREHILAHPQFPGATASHHAGHFPTSGHHDILVTTVAW